MLNPETARAIRERALVTQDEVTAELGVHRVTVARWESGARSPRGSMRQQYRMLLAALEQALSPDVRKTRLQRLRETRGLNLPEAGALFGVSPRVLARLEDGQADTARETRGLEKAAEFLGYADPSELLSPVDGDGCED